MSYNHKKYRAANGEQILDKAKKYYMKNKNKKREYVLKNKLKIALRMKEYRLRYEPLNKEKINFRKKKYNTKRYHMDKLFKLKKLVSSRFHKFIRYNRHTKEYLPYSLKQLKEHIESQFTPEMSWENHGTYWHIDHITPLSWFKTEEELINKGWALNNMQPLPKELNMRKNNYNNKTLEELL